MAKLAYTPLRYKSSDVYVPCHLQECEFIFVRNDTIRRPLTPIYTGPLKVLSHADKHITIRRGNNKDTVSIDQVKPAFIEKENCFPIVTWQSKSPCWTCKLFNEDNFVSILIPSQSLLIAHPCFFKNGISMKLSIVFFSRKLKSPKKDKQWMFPLQVKSQIQNLCWLQYVNQNAPDVVIMEWLPKWKATRVHVRMPCARASSVFWWRNADASVDSRYDSDVMETLTYKSFLNVQPGVRLLVTKETAFLPIMSSQMVSWILNNLLNSNFSFSTIFACNVSK